jgi:rhamnosyltransferase
MPERRPAGIDVCAVLVTYHPDSGFPARLSRIVPQVGETVIVDNGSRDESSSMLRELSAWPALTVVNNAENLGIAGALNIGVQHSLARGYSWAILLDQDTQVDEDMVERLLAARASWAGGRLAAVGSRFRDTNARPAEIRRLDASGELWEEVESVITSGSLLSLEAYAAIGPFRNEFFIDHVDTEYCFRARAAGFRVIETRRPLMSHTIGAPTVHRMLGKTTWTTNHSPDRRYYIARNNTVLLREYGTSEGGSWRLKSVIRCLRLCKRIAFFEQDKIAKILAVGQGWWDGVRGNMGPRGRTAKGSKLAATGPASRPAPAMEHRGRSKHGASDH